MKKYKYLFIIFCSLLFLILIIVGGYYYLDAQPKNSLENKPRRFVVSKGDTLKIVAKKLKKANLIKSEKFFVIYAKLKGLSTEIKSGEYLIHEDLNSSEILDILAKGEIVTVKFTIPEGYTVNQIADLLELKGLVKKEDFFKAVTDKGLLKKYGIPFHSAEGFLFPDTYIISKDLDAKQITEIMLKRFFEELNKLSDISLNIDELKKIVIIASLVEKEAKEDGERPVIAAVFYNRLKKNKRLQSCATVQYVLGKTKERLLYKDLKIKSPYNTYLHRGLPPGPISNPGSKSIWAAIHPAKVDYLYFVSKHDGSHYFSKTYA